MSNIKTKEKQLLVKKIKALLIDIVSINYFLIIVIRVFINKITNYFGEFTWEQFIIINIFGSILGLYWASSNTSLGCKITGLIQERKPNILDVLRNIFIGTLIIITIVTAIIITEFSLATFCDMDGLCGAYRIFSAMLHPKFTIFNDVLFAVIETVYIAFMATILAVPLAFFLSFLGAKNIMNKNKTSRFIYIIVRFLLNVFRSIEPLIWAIVFSVWVGIGPFAGMLALMINSIAGLIKLYSEQIEHVDEGLLVAITATGAFPIQIMWYAVVPQIMLPFLGYTIYRWDVNVRMATVIGLVGGGGIGTLLMQYQGLAKWNEVGLIIITISAVVWIMDYSSAKIREMVA